MAGYFKNILSFLSPKSVINQLEKQLEYIPDTFGQITFYDDQAQIMKGWVGTQEGEIIEMTWTFDDYFMSELEQIIIETKVEIRNLRFGSEISLKVYSNKEIQTILSRLVQDLKARHSAIMKTNLPLPKSLALILRFINSLKKEINRYSGKDKAKKRKTKALKFVGYEIQSSEINDPQMLVEELANILIEKKQITQKQEFISLFTNRWNGVMINWFGTPKDFCTFYSTLFNPSNDGSNRLINIAGYKLRLQKLLECFNVKDPKSNKRLNNKSIKHFNSKLKSVSLYRQLSFVIDNHRRK